MKTLLIVEDEKMIRQGIRAMIQRSGVPVETIMECNNGQVALEILESQKIDAMFTDIRMPKMDGIELVRRVRALPERPLIVAVSGYDDFSYAVEMLRSGVKEYLLKPLDREKLKEVMEKLENELVRQEEEKEDSRRLGCQQLKYMLLNPTISEKEVQAVVDRFEGQLLEGEYFVCCAGGGEEDIEIRTGFLRLGEVEGNYLYIIQKENRERFLDNELRESCVGISGLHRGIASLRKAYEEAGTARKEAFIRSRLRVEYKSEPSEEKGNATEGETGENRSVGWQQGAETMPDMYKIAQMVGTDKFTEGLKELEKLIFAMKHSKGSAGVFEEQMGGLIGWFKDIYRNTAGEELKELDRFDNPYCFDNVDRYLEELTDWIIRLHEKLDSRTGDYRNKQKIQDALGYISKNYATDLNMAVVSNYVSMNYSLFSFAFKEYTGQNFVSYLKRLRMEKAKKLLAETELRIVEISQRVGYENEKHFMKLFKNECGVSPTEYRKNLLPARK
ncbi:MAG: response regulator [Clostridiales bacterium]|nr:response regulator [Clostridiales bacterium]